MTGSVKTLDIAVAGRRLPLTIRENRRATRMTLRIEPGGGALKMTIPAGVGDREVRRFLLRHNGWLDSRLSKLPPVRHPAHGAWIPLRGTDHRIHCTGRVRELCRPGEIDGEPVLFVGGAPEHLSRRLAEFLKREARHDLESAVARHCERAGLAVKTLRLKDTRSRWGSCSSSGNLSFSWRIVMAPDHVIDYLAAHEVAHLREMNHGRAFWALCEDLCPRTPEARKWLKNNGSGLHSIDFSRPVVT